MSDTTQQTEAPDTKPAETTEAPAETKPAEGDGNPTQADGQQ